MSLFLDNPIFRREARWGRRLRRLRRNRPLAIIVTCVAVAIGWLYWRGLNLYVDPQTSDDSGGLWRLCSNFYLGLIVLLAPALASSAISKEKEQQTWETLATTNLTAAQILVGKWLGRVIPVGGVGLALLPLLLISAFAAGISLLGVLSVLAFLMLTTGLYSIIGLTCSFVARKTLTATTVALLLAALLCIGTWVVQTLLLRLSVDGGDFVAMARYSGLPSPLWLNPFYVLPLLTQGPAPEAAFYGDDGPLPSAAGAVNTYWIASLLIIAVCFYYMFTRYRRAVRGGRPLGETLN